jgi:hypothetical protein
MDENSWDEFTNNLEFEITTPVKERVTQEIQRRVAEGIAEDPSTNRKSLLFLLLRRIHGKSY